MIALLCGGKAPQKRALFVADLRREVMAENRVSLKGIKTLSTGAFVASFYWDGKKIGTVEDGGRGACYRYCFGYEKLRECEAWAKEFLGDEASSVENLDHVVAKLIDEHLAKKKLKSWCKKGIVLKMKDGSYLTYKVGYTVALADRLREKHRDDLECVVNETI